MQVLLFINNKHAQTGAGFQHYGAQFAALAGGDILRIADVSENMMGRDCFPFRTGRTAAKR